jgi:hypothetical protein
MNCLNNHYNCNKFTVEFDFVNQYLFIVNYQVEILILHFILRKITVLWTLPWEDCDVTTNTFNNIVTGEQKYQF